MLEGCYDEEVRFEPLMEPLSWAMLKHARFQWGIVVPVIHISHTASLTVDRPSFLVAVHITSGWWLAPGQTCAQICRDDEAHA